jgi:glycosyltransferase involved in cell wall biosynthesis
LDSAEAIFGILSLPARLLSTVVTPGDRISVVLRTHNGERWLEQTLRAVLAQTVLPEEIIVADDASTDRSLAVTQEVLSCFEGDLALLSSDYNLGQNRNLARCLDRVTGDIVVQCDQDDVWHPEKLAVIARAFATGPEVTMVFSDADLIGADGLPAGGNLWPSVGFTPANQRRWRRDPLGVLLRRTVVTGATIAFRRSLLEVAIPFTQSGWEDEWLALLAVLRAEPPVAIPRRLLDYRLHGANTAGIFTGGWRERLSRAGWPDRDKVRMWEEAVARVGADSPEARRLSAAVAFHRRRPDRAMRSLPRARLVVASCADYFRYGQGLAMIAHDLAGVLVYGRPSHYRAI